MHEGTSGQRERPPVSSADDQMIWTDPAGVLRASARHRGVWTGWLVSEAPVASADGRGRDQARVHAAGDEAPGDELEMRAQTFSRGDVMVTQSWS